jgi:hypothetical protein
MKFRKVNSLVVVAVSFACFMGGMFLERYTNKPVNKSHISLECYRDYFVATEHLLDLIDKQYHWVDGIDHQGYYETRTEVEYHDSMGIAAAQVQFQKVLDWENQQNK